MASLTDFLAYLLILIVSFASVSCGTPTKGSNLARDITDYFLVRHTLNSLRTNSTDLRQGNEKRDLTRRTETEGAVPFWLQNEIPHIIVEVGNPPQSTELSIDTGSHLTWIQGAVEQTFKPRLSSTWRPKNQTTFIEYLDGMSCSVSIGYDDINISGHTLPEVLMGVSHQTLSNDCSKNFRQGVLGLDRSSDVLKRYLMQKPENSANVFSFAFRDEVTGTGANLFSLGGYAGLNPERIIWLAHYSGNEKDNGYRIELPYVIFRNRKVNFERGHTAVVDTGSTIGLLPGDIISKVYSREAGMKRFWLENLNRITLFKRDFYFGD
jgi:Eukaryotic aspartyl protease